MHTHRASIWIRQLKKQAVTPGNLPKLLDFVVFQIAGICAEVLGLPLAFLIWDNGRITVLRSTRQLETGRGETYEFSIDAFRNTPELSVVGLLRANHW
jgi:hypothetical protein